jgi:hypothetical protein
MFRLHPSLMRALLAVFTAVQLSPAGLTVCRDEAGGVSFGCSCADCQAGGDGATAACCGLEEGGPAQGICPACGEELQAASRPAGLGPALSACCEHSSVDYAAPAALKLLSPALALPAVPPTTAFPPSLPGLVVPEWSTAGCQRAYPPPGGSCPPASGVSVLPLRI